MVRIFQPETVLKWHRELGRCKWTQEHANKGGRPKIDYEIKALIVRLAEENLGTDYGKFEGKMIKLGVKLESIPYSV